MTTPAAPTGQAIPSLDQLLALAERIEARKDSVMTVPGNRVWLYTEALRALAQEKERG